MDAFLGQEILLALMIMAAAGLAHGTFGFGFPMVATPMLALLTDVQTAILLTLFPTMAVNLWSLLRGGNLGASVGRFWPVAVWMLLGSVLGTLMLVALDPNPLRLLLALVIVVYLLNEQIKRLDWSWIRRHPQSAGAVAGLSGGLLGGTVNVGGPALMIYFLEMRVAPLVLIQAINLAFLLGKSTQAATFAVLGLLPWALVVLSFPLLAAALIGLRIGMLVQDRISAATYRGWLRGLLWGLAILLLAQFFRELNINA